MIYGPSDGSHLFSGKPHGYHHGKGRNPKGQDGSLSRYHHPVKNTECVASSKGKSHNYHPATRQHNSVDSAKKPAHASHHRMHEQNDVYLRPSLLSTLFNGNNLHVHHFFTALFPEVKREIQSHVGEAVERGEVFSVEED